VKNVPISNYIQYLILARAALKTSRDRNQVISQRENKPQSETREKLEILSLMSSSFNPFPSLPSTAKLA